MKLTDIQVDRYGPLPRLTHECEDNFEVFYGPNESGKTLLLEAILKLLTPKISSTIPHISRVDESPTGHIVVETNGTEQKLGDGTAIGDITDLSPTHLQNIFVVRDSDLQLQDEHDFYDSITQQIGDIHTNEIDSIQSRLVDTGRLTSLRGRKISSANRHDHAKDVRNEATDLATNISDYLSEAKENDIAAAERELIRVKSELHRCERALTVQDAAETWDTHSMLTKRLETYKKATQQLENGASQSTLEQLDTLDRNATEATDEIDNLENKRSSLNEERTQFEIGKKSVETELTPLQKRANDIDDIDRKLTLLRNTHSESIGASRGMNFARYVALVGVGLGGIAAVLGNTVIGVLLVVIGGLAAVWYGLQHRSVTATEREREQLLQQARDAGLEVSEVEDIGTAVRDFHDRLESLQERRNELSQKIRLKEGLIEESNQELQTERQNRRANEERKQELLQKNDANDLEEYRRRVTRSVDLQQNRQQAAQSLKDTLGIPHGGDPSKDEKISYWESELDAMVADTEENVTADEYDSRALSNLRDEQQQLQQRRDDLDDRLEAHEQRLRDFDEQINTISSQPFVNDPVTLQSRSIEGLQEVARELNKLVEQIERDADIAREALDIFDEIQTEEEQKITDLFGENSRATEVFGEITDGRYTGVDYDAGEQTLQVQRNGQAVLTPQQLSHGTMEQLYLAARVGLAEQLLSSEPGFFIMDDALLPADRTRLENGFEVLQELAANGWQILYFTAKDEIGDELVKTHNVRCRTLDRLG